MEGRNNSNIFGGFIDSNEDNLLDTLLMNFSQDNLNAPIAPTPQVGSILGGSVSFAQGQVMSQTSNLNQFFIMQNENLLRFSGNQPNVGLINPTMHSQNSVGLINPTIQSQNSVGPINPTMQSQNSVRPINPMCYRTSDENIRMILDMNPDRMVDTAGKVHYQAPRRGRPPKRRELGKKLLSQFAKKVSSNAGKARTGTSTPPQVPNASNNVQNTSSGPRQFENAVYDLQYERDGLFIDPNLRLRHAQSTPPEPDAEN